MLYKLAANSVVIIHFIFILFVIIGGFMTWRWRWIIWLHIPAALWATLIVSLRWICPLTPLENRLRHAAGEAGYSGGFIEQYLIPLIYPSGFPDEIFLLMGAGILLINVFAYSVLYIRSRHKNMASSASHSDK